jgi:hypothetical protein
VGAQAQRREGPRGAAAELVKSRKELFECKTVIELMRDAMNLAHRRGTRLENVKA